MEDQNRDQLSAAEPEIEGDPGNGYWYVCPDCHGYLKWHEESCPHCGRRLNWFG